MEDFLYEISSSSAKDVITLFKTVDITDDTSSYIYNLFPNENINDFIEEISNLYINNGVYSILFEILDGWMDYFVNKKRDTKEHLREKIHKILIKLIRSDKVQCDRFYINVLKNQFNINYHAETMIG